jgi:vitamin B12 transporter
LWQNLHFIRIWIGFMSLPLMGAGSAQAYRSARLPIYAENKREQQEKYMHRLNFSLITAVVFALACAAVPSHSQEQDSSPLDAVVVTVSKHEESLREVTSNVTLIDSEEIQKTVGNNLLSLLAEKGFQAYMFGGTNYGNAASSVSYVRGYGSSSMAFSEVNAFTMVLLNGHRMNNSYVNMINLVNIDRIEIIRGPAAVQYGPSALGGVINIITKRGEGPLTGRVLTAIGSFDKDEEQLSLSGAYQGFDFSVGASRSSYGDYSTGKGTVFYHTNVDGAYGLDADFGYTFQDNHRIGFHYNYQSIEGDVPGYGDDLMQIARNTFSTVDNYAWNSTISYSGSTPDKRLSWFANYTFAKSKFLMVSFMDENDPAYWAAYYPHFPEKNYNSSSIIDMDQLQVQMTYDHPVFSLTAGFDYVKYKGHNYSWSSSFGITDERTHFKDLAGYLLAKLRLLDGDLIITAGGRYDSFQLSNETNNYSEKKFTPSFGVAYSPLPYLKLRAHYSEGFSVPNTTQIFGGMGYIANPELKPQQNKTYEFGADLSIQHFNASVTYFISEFSNKFTAFPVALYTAQTRNLDAASLAGLELYMSYDIGKALGYDFSLVPYVNLTWMTKAENKDTNTFVSIAPDKLPDTPDLLVSYGVRFDYPAINLSARINANYFGKIYTQNFEHPDYLSGTVDDGPWTEHGGFTVVDLSFSKRLLDFGDKGNLELEGKVGNLFNTAKGYNLVTTVPGRNFYLSVSYNF